jgi:hypothetical protein
MEKLTQNINIRTNLNIKKRLMDEASSLDMNMSEYVLLILQSHWDKKTSHLLRPIKNLLFPVSINFQNQNLSLVN